MKTSALIDFLKEQLENHGDMEVSSTFDGLELMIDEDKRTDEGFIGTRLDIDTWRGEERVLHGAELIEKINELSRGENLPIVQFARWEGHYYISNQVERVHICEANEEEGSYWGDFQIIGSERGEATRFWTNSSVCKEQGCKGVHYDAIIIATEV